MPSRQGGEFVAVIFVVEDAQLDGLTKFAVEVVEPLLSFLEQLLLYSFFLLLELLLIHEGDVFFLLLQLELLF